MQVHQQELERWIFADVRCSAQLVVWDEQDAGPRNPQQVVSGHCAHHRGRQPTHSTTSAQHEQGVVTERLRQVVEAKDTCLQGRQPLLQPVQVLLQVVRAVYEPCT